MHVLFHALGGADHLTVPVAVDGQCHKDTDVLNATSVAPKADTVRIDDRGVFVIP